jgi:hypothetical protein
MIPTALLVLLVTSLFVFLGLVERGQMWIGSLAIIVIVWLVRPVLARRVTPNTRIGLSGSRFSPEETQEAISPR